MNRTRLLSLSQTETLRTEREKIKSHLSTSYLIEELKEQSITLTNYVLQINKTLFVRRNFERST
jgi:hypothetical protein